MPFSNTFFKKTLLAGLIASTVGLTGCGGSSDSSGSDPVNPTPSGTEITVIDGYLYNAEVYIDTNDNNVADESELQGSTDEKGVFYIDPDILGEHKIITKSVAGVTKDADQAGFVANTYSMIAEANSNVVTPFTTMADVQGVTVEELAADMNLDPSVISGDYTQSDSGDAQKAQVYARSITPHFSEEIANNDTESLTQASDVIVTAVDEAENNGEDLSTIVVTVDESGNASVVNNVSSISNFMKGQTYGIYLDDEAIAEYDLDKSNQEISFDYDVNESDEPPIVLTYSDSADISCKSAEDDKFCQTYSGKYFLDNENGIMNISYSYQDSDGYDSDVSTNNTFSYASGGNTIESNDDFAIVAQENTYTDIDMQEDETESGVFHYIEILSKNSNLGKVFGDLTPSQFDGKTYYAIEYFDNEEVDGVTLNKYVFKDGNLSKYSFYQKTESFADESVEINYTLQNNEMLLGENSYQNLVSDNQVIVLYNALVDNDGQSHILLIKDKSLATKIYQQTNGLSEK